MIPVLSDFDVFTVLRGRIYLTPRIYFLPFLGRAVLKWAMMAQLMSKKTRTDHYIQYCKQWKSTATLLTLRAGGTCLGMKHDWTDRTKECWMLCSLFYLVVWIPFRNLYFISNTKYTLSVEFVPAQVRGNRPIAHDVTAPVTMHLEDKLAIYA